MNVPPTRQYNSPRRAKDAADTRRAILTAAMKLFATNGYARVTVSDIAKRAKVAVPTVYASTGGKGDILRTVIADAVESAGVGSIVDSVRATKTLHEAIQVLASGIRQANANLVTVMRIMLDARTVDCDAEKMWNDRVAEYRGGLRETAALLQSRDQLGPGLTVDVAADLLWFYLGMNAWRALVHDSGWDWDEAECWLRRHAESALRNTFHPQC